MEGSVVGEACESVHVQVVRSDGTFMFNPFVSVLMSTSWVGLKCALVVFPF